MHRTFATGEDTILRRELTARDAACRRRDFLLVLIGGVIFALIVGPIGGLIARHLIKEPHSILMTVFLSSILLFLVALAIFFFLSYMSMTRFSFSAVYLERIYPGFFEQQILGYRRTINLATATIQVRKKGLIGLYLIQIHSPDHWTISLGALTKSETDLFLAYRNQAIQKADTKA